MTCTRSTATVLVAAALLTAGCQADVEGYWGGTIGRSQGFLALEQNGAVVRGEACLDGACDDRARGEVRDGRLTLSFGCLTCDEPPQVRLDLEVSGEEMSGIAILEGCQCEASTCGCGQPARFGRVAGYGP